MTKSKKKILILLTLVIFFIFSNISKNFITDKQSLEFNEKDQVQIKLSGFYDLTGSPIFIDDSDPSKNWSYTALNYVWCSGSGSWADPYVIENVTIDGQVSGNCIEIKNSDAYFIIRNCSLFNSGPSLGNVGIKLDTVDNGKIISTNCSDNSDGISLGQSNNNTLFGNTASNNDYNGIFLESSNNNNLSGNTANNNRYGIYLGQSNNNNLSVNTASNNKLYGIYLKESNNNNLSGNIMDFCGISLSGSLEYLASHSIDTTNLVNNKPVYYYVNELGLGSSDFTNAGQIILINCSNSIISGFNLSNSNTGIYLGYSNNNTLSGNNASNNNLYGIYLGYSNNNTLSGNTACNNSEGIYLGYSDNNTLSVNTACNNSDGISLENSNNNTLSGNTANNYYRGISLENSDNNTLSGNTASNNTSHAIFLGQSNNNNLSGNIMNFCGIYLSGSLVELASHVIDDTNLVNDKPVYYYVNELGLGSSNFMDAGQIFLINCNDSIILDLEFSYCSSAISLWNCFNNTIFNNTAFNLYYPGISISNCINISVSQNNVSNCFMDGIKINNANHINLTKNNVENCAQGIYVPQCTNIIITNNTMINNSLVALYCDNTFENITITGNIMNGSGLLLMNIDIIKATFDIDQSNLVNGKILYYYINENSLTHNNFTNAGQIYLYNCSDISFSNLDLSRSTLGLMLFQCNNLTFSNIDSSYNSFAAVMIYNCNNSKFSELTIKNCSYFGLNLINSRDTIISNSTITDNNKAFELSHCLNITLAGNYFDNNNLDSISMQSCSNNTLINNTINNNKMKSLVGYYEGNALSLSDSSYNNITGNNVLNSDKIGIHIEGNSNNNTFLRNIIANNSQYGIFICVWGESDNNTFYLNNLINNGINAEDNGDNNRWDNGDAGNYWDDYFVVDISPIDGIGDTSYLILGTAGKSDFKPLVFRTYEDTDGDWLINYEEYILGDDNYLTNVTNPDTDYDGLSDYWEWRNSTNPWEPDSDFDNMPDLWEVTNSLNANFNDAMVDSDLDLLLNLYEYRNGTNPWEPDSDFDNMPDGWEVFNSLNPLYDDAFNDTDNDLLENIYEYHNGTNPQNNDTESDGMPDGWEVINGLLPLTDDSTGDPDSDNLFNVDEFLSGTNPHNDDTDGDTFLDGTEVNLNTNPLNRWWYPMPNLEILEFKAQAADYGKPFALNFTIINNGIWRAENVIIIIRIDYINETIYTNIGSPIDLNVDQTYQKLIQITGVETSGGLVMELILDPLNLINETYSSKDGSLREDGEDTNSEETVLQIVGDLPPDLFDPFWLILIILAIVTISTGVSLFIVFRPKIKRRAALKRQIALAKTDIKNFEINMHSFIKVQLKDYYKSLWWEEGIPGYIRKTVDSKIEFEKPGKHKISIDKTELLDLSHITSIITESNNWEHIFSETFPDKNVVEENFEKLRTFKKNLVAGNVTHEEIINYPLFIHAIRNYFTRGFNVFLSYSTLDTDYFKIREVAQRIEAYPKIDRVFLWETDSGESIVTYMERTLRLSKIFVFFCSENSMKSKAVEDEWQAAFQMRKKGLMKIVPVFEKEELIPFLLMPLLNVKYTKDDFDGFIQKLYDEILR